MKLRLATCRGLPTLWHDDAGLPAALLAHGIEAAPVPWQDIEAGDPVLLRSPWDYAQDRDRFCAWIDHLEAAGTMLINPATTVRWNLDKRYLLELRGRGHQIVETEVLPAYERAAVVEVRDARGWSGAVAKPVVGCGAEGLVVVAGDGERTFDPQGNVWAATSSRTPVGPCLVQPLLDMEAGEWSLVFVAGGFSHAILKRPAAGDIRVQEEHGGTTMAASPPPALKAAAQAVVRDLPAHLYARVDGVATRSGLSIMEVELIEPELYFRTSPPAMARFAAAVAASLKDNAFEGSAGASPTT